MIPSLLNRLPHTRRIRRHERKKFVDGCSPRGRDRFRRKKRGLDAAARRCCAMVGEGRDKRVLGRTVNRRERKGKGRSVSNCERVSSRARLSSVENGEAVLALEVCTPWVRVGRGREIPKKFTRNVRRMPRKEDSLTFGTLGWRALPLDYDRSGSIQLSFSRVADLVGTMPFQGTILSMSYAFIHRITYLGSTAQRWAHALSFCLLLVLAKFWNHFSEPVSWNACRFRE